MGVAYLNSRMAVYFNQGTSRILHVADFGYCKAKCTCSLHGVDPRCNSNAQAKQLWLSLVSLLFFLPPIFHEAPRSMADLLAARLFESESAAKANFPTLFSPRELGNDTTLIVKCLEDGFEDGCRQRDGTNPDTPLFLDILLSPDTPIPNSASQRVLRRLDSIALIECRGASESLLEAQQNPQGPYFKWEREKRLCPRKSSAKV